MKQVVDVWGTVVGAKGVAVQNLFLRGSSLVWRQQIGGKRVTRAVPVRRLRQGETLSRDLVKQAVDWMKKAESVVLEDTRGWDAIEGTRARREEASFKQVFETFLAAAKRRGEPREDTARAYVWALRKVVSVALGCKVDDVDGLRVSVIGGAAGGDVVTDYLEKCKEARGDSDSTLRSVKSTVNQARQLFQAGFMEEYEKLKLPDLSKFLHRFVVKVDSSARGQFSAAEIATLESGRDLKESRPDLYAVWFLGYYCALRAGESVQARASWLREYEITPADRQGWMGERKKVWVLDCGADPDAQLKSAASAGVVPLADDVAEELRRIIAGREFVVPGESASARKHAVREFSAWLVGKGWAAGKGRKKSHDLRALRMQKWSARYSEAMAKIWQRHEVQGVSRNYLGRISMALVLRKRPLGMAE